MGGAAFVSGPDALATPRMSPQVYREVRARCHASLRPLFAAVATPVDGPGKADFGDVDAMALVAETAATAAAESADEPRPSEVATAPKPKADDHVTEYSRHLQAAVARLGAVRAQYKDALGQVSMAIPWPADLLPGRSADGDGPAPALFVQVDLALFHTLEALRWALVRHAHGDLWNMLGTAVLRPSGLTADERALWLRIPEIEAGFGPRTEMRVFLTDDPRAMLRFLELPVDDEGDEERKDNENEYENDVDLDLPWTHPLATPAALFDLVACCRFFVLPAAVDANTPVSAADRRRLQRPLYRQWVNEDLPRRRLGEDASRPRPSRDLVRDAAFAAFPGARERYTAQRSTWLHKQRVLAIRTATRDAVPAWLPVQFRGVVRAAVRKRLFEDPLARTADPYAAWTPETVAAWVAEHWRAVTAEEKPIEHARFEAWEASTSSHISD